MRYVVPIIEPIGRRVSDEDINAAVGDQMRVELIDPGTHRMLRILVWTMVVLHGTTQSQDAKSLKAVQLSIDINAAFRRFLLVLAVVIAADIENRSMGERCEKGKIVCGKIAAGDDQINPFQLGFIKIIP